MQKFKELIYRLALWGYGTLISLWAYFNNPKAQRWIEGRKGWRETVKEKMDAIQGQRIWMHCASLGEFEQGRPLLEQFRNEYPSIKIVLSFFSPSGYDIQKNTRLADAVFYMPLDGPQRSLEFIKLIKPDMVFFVKYEFWFFYGKYLHQLKIPYFCISAAFRPTQIFFKPYGDFFRRMLLRFTHIFAQDQASLSLLYKHRVANVTVAGDTRLDRVWANGMRPMNDELIEAFCENQLVLVAGSTWIEDEKLLYELLRYQPSLRLILAPHELSESHLHELKNQVAGTGVFYSETTLSDVVKAKILVIDNIGMLSKLYRFGKYAYIGGGFGEGIHNILEAAVYGRPVFIGPAYDRFNEARDLIKQKGAFCVLNATEFFAQINRFEEDEALYKKTSDICSRYVGSRKGATEIIMNYLRMNGWLR